MRELMIVSGLAIAVLGIFWGTKWYTRLMAALIGMAIIVGTMILTSPNE